MSYILKKKSICTHWFSLSIDRNTAVYLDSFGIEYISSELVNKIKDKSMTHSIFQMQSDNSICEDFIVLPSQRI